MPNVEITQRDIEGLAAKLSTLTPQLTEHEHVLLSVVLDAATEVLAKARPASLASAAPVPGGADPRTPPDIPSVRDLVLSAFAPDTGTDTDPLDRKVGNVAVRLPARSGGTAQPGEVSKPGKTKA